MRMNELKNIIITCFVAPAIYETLKFVLLFIKNKFQEGDCSYTISGYLCAKHFCTEDNGNMFSACELVKIKQNNSRLFATLYQQTNDMRFYTYNCIGYIKGRKISLSYAEVNNKHSNDTGTFNLLRIENNQHKPCFKGVYSEFIKNEDCCSSKEYILIPVTLKWYDKVLIILFRGKYAKKIMKKEQF